MNRFDAWHFTQGWHCKMKNYYYYSIYSIAFWCIRKYALHPNLSDRPFEIVRRNRNLTSFLRHIQLKWLSTYRKGIIKKTDSKRNQALNSVPGELSSSSQSLSGDLSRVLNQVRKSSVCLIWCIRRLQGSHHRFKL